MLPMHAYSYPGAAATPDQSAVLAAAAQQQLLLQQELFHSQAMQRAARVASAGSYYQTIGAAPGAAPHGAGQHPFSNVAL